MSNSARRSRGGAALCPGVVMLLMGWGCAVGPDYHAPATTMSAAYSGATRPATTEETSTVSQAPLELVEWWKVFGDAELNSLVERGVAANLDVRAAVSRIRQARASSREASAGLWPTVNVDGQAIRSYSNPAGRTNLFQIGLDANWELDLFGGTRRAVEAANAGIAVAVEDRRNVLVTLLSEVALDYVQLRGYQEQIRIAQDNYKAEKHTLDVTQRRQRVGFQSGLDAANAEAVAETTEAQIPVLETSARQTIYSISILLALEPAALEKELAPAAAIPGVPVHVPVGLPSELLRRRPDVREAERQLAAATANIGVATADLFPKFSLTGSFGQQGGKLSAMDVWANRYWSFGPTVTWPIFDAGQIQANIDVQNELQVQALLQYKKTVLTALQDVENALVAYSKEQVHRAILTRAVAANQRAMDLSMRLYTDGLLEFVNVLVVEEALDASENQLVQSQISVLTDLVALYKALGGGWEHFEDSTKLPASRPQSIH